MKKVLKIITVVLIVLITAFIAFFAAARTFGDKLLCFYADKLYAEKDYQTAYVLYDAINLYRPEKEEYQYKLTKCLTKMPLSYSVQKKLVEIAQKDDNSRSEKLATEIILRFREKVYKNLGDSYAKETLYNGIVLHWSKKSFPLTYFISAEANSPSYYIEMAKSAFQDWQRETEDFVKFIPVNNEASAKIVVKFQGKANKENSDNQFEYKAAITSPIIENEKVLKQMKIKVLVKNHLGTFFEPQQMKTLMAHEIGHALGMWGHSNDNKTIMYYSLNNPYDYYEKRIDTSLNSKDIATLKILYSLAPDISDNKEELIYKERFIYPPMLFSPVDNTKEKMLKSAEQLLKEHPGDMGYALSLADAYNQSGKYNESINLMIFLSEQTNDKSLLSLLYYNIANNYIGLKDFTNALIYAKLALKCSNTLDNRSLIAYIKYCSGDLKNAEKEFIFILGKNPGFTNAALGLADVYIKQKKYLEARKVLKQLVKYNPEALNDKALNAYKIYTML